MKTQIFLILTTFFSVGSAFAGPSDGGGGLAIIPQAGQAPVLFDEYQNQGTQKFDLANYPDVRSGVEKILQRTTSMLPGFGEALRGTLTGKKWLIEPKPISPNMCDGSAHVAYEGQVITAACQKKFEVRIASAFFLDARVPVEQKAKLVIHEMVQSFRIASFTEEAPIDYQAVVDITNELFDSSVSAVNLQNDLTQRGFAIYRTAVEVAQENAEITRLNALVKDQQKQICGQKIGDGNFYDQVQALSSTLWDLAQQPGGTADTQLAQLAVYELIDRTYAAPIRNGLLDGQDLSNLKSQFCQSVVAVQPVKH